VELEGIHHWQVILPIIIQSSVLLVYKVVSVGVDVGVIATLATKGIVITRLSNIAHATDIADIT